MAIDPVDALPPFGEFDEADFPSVTPELMPALKVPLALIGAAKGVEQVNGVACAPADENYKAFFEAAPSATLLWDIPSAGHAEFSDPCASEQSSLGCSFCVQGQEPERTHAFALQTLVSFFKYHLEQKADYLPFLQGTALESRFADFVSIQEKAQ
ncbi:MAG: hypothetical protein IPJ88_03490 [Myxococcales bacterium]|nr:MAG: hypothetical protein IPJ88_03490 [Myxococcales bacterium]